jgi:hypothetical protein
MFCNWREEIREENRERERFLRENDFIITKTELLQLEHIYL